MFTLTSLELGRVPKHTTAERARVSLGFRVSPAVSRVFCSSLPASQELQDGIVDVFQGFTASGLSGTTEADPMTALENASNE
ncbi:Junction-Mediating And -Regulatory Protein [Manis pentadactyla]|nr:Junction-Mediating And -Regulatory Protein [Manis pentadactyla]